MPVERYGSKTDVIVKLVLVFFISLLSFSIGTFVGKKFSDNQHRLANLEPDTQKAEVAQSEHDEAAPAADVSAEDNRAVASISPDAHEVRPDKALTDEEIAKLAEEFVIDDEKSAVPAKLIDKNDSGHTSTKNETTAPQSAPTLPKPEVTPPTMAKQETLKPAQRMAEGKAPVIENPPVPTSRIPSSLPKEVASSGIGKYTVQIGAYGTEKEAQKMAAELKANKGLSPFYVAAQVNGKTWYRVSVGLFATMEEARTQLNQLKSEGKFSTAIIQKVTKAE